MSNYCTECMELKELDPSAKCQRCIDDRENYDEDAAEYYENELFI